MPKEAAGDHTMHSRDTDMSHPSEKETANRAPTGEGRETSMPASERKIHDKAATGNTMKGKGAPLFSSSPGRAFFLMALPSVLAQVVTAVYQFADTFFIGRAGAHEAVAAVSVAMPFYQLLAAVGSLFGIGGASVVSRALGEGDLRRVRSTFLVCLTGAAVCGALYGGGVWLFRFPLIRLTGGASVSDAAYHYLLPAVTAGAVPTVLAFVCGHLLRACGHSVLSAVGIGLGAGVNIALDPLFIRLFAHRNGVAGAVASATLASNLLSCVFFAFVFWRLRSAHLSAQSAQTDAVFSLSQTKPERGSPCACKAEGPARMRLSLVGEVLSVGAPSAVVLLCSTVSGMVANALLAPFGEAALSGMGVARRLTALSFQVTMGITQGALPLLGYAYATKEKARLSAYTRLMTGTALLSSSATFLVYYFFAPSLVALFLSDGPAVSEGISYLMILSFAMPLCAVSYSYTALFSACGLRLYPLLLSLLRRGTVDILLMFALPALFGPHGVAFATPAAEVLALAVALLMFRAAFRPPATQPPHLRRPADASLRP